jgi:iron complex outermembrane receptor protein
VVAGGDYRDHYRQDYWSGLDAERWFDENMPYRSWSAFALAEQRLAPSLNLVLGARHDRLSDGGRSTTPRAALVWDDGITTLKALAGTAFRFPNFYERYFEDVEYGVLAGGDLDPEKVRTYEVVAGRRLGGGLYGGVALFHSDISDLVTIVPLEDDETTFVNGPEMETRGVETSLEARLPARTVAHVSYTWVRGREVDTGKDALNVPEHVVQLHGHGYPAPFLLLGADGRYETGRRTLWDTRTSSVLLLNTHIQAPDLLPGLTPGLRVRNLLDREHALPGGAEMPTDRVSQPRRHWILELRYRF